MLIVSPECIYVLMTFSYYPALKCEFFSRYLYLDQDFDGYGTLYILCCTLIFDQTQ